LNFGKQQQLHNTSVHLGVQFHVKQRDISTKEMSHQAGGDWKQNCADM